MIHALAVHAVFGGQKLHHAAHSLLQIVVVAHLRSHERRRAPGRAAGSPRLRRCCDASCVLVTAGADYGRRISVRLLHKSTSSFVLFEAALIAVNILYEASSCFQLRDCVGSKGTTRGVCAQVIEVLIRLLVSFFVCSMIIAVALARFAQRDISRSCGEQAVGHRRPRC